MDIFEYLESLNVSEECFNSIINIVEKYINEMKPETYGSAMAERRNRFMKDINKNDELKDKYIEAKKSGNEEETNKAADEWNEHEMGMKHDRSSNQNKYGRDKSRVNFFSTIRNWSDKDKEAFMDAYKKGQTTQRKNGRDYRFYTKW